MHKWDRLLPGNVRAAIPAVVLLAAFLLAACSTPTARLSGAPAGGLGAPPGLQATAGPAAPPAATPSSGGSFGPSLNDLNLPAAPPTTASSAPPATAPPVRPPAPPANPASTPRPTTPPSAGTQTQPLPSIDVRGRLAYVRPDGQIWTIGRAGSDPQALAAHPTGSEPPGRVANLNLSPDANLLLYTVDPNTAGQRVFEIDLRTGAISRQKYNGAWAPDSRHIVVTPGSQLVVVDMASGTEQTLGEGANANWTAAGDLIAVRQGNIWRIPYPVARGPARQITAFPASGPAAWAFSGLLQYHYTDHIVFAGAPQNALDAAGNGLRLESVDVASGRSVDLTPAGGNQVRFLALSPDGLQLASAEQTARSECVSAGTVRIARPANPGTQTLIGVPQDDTRFFFMRGLTWSPDQQLVYAGLERGCAGGALTDRPPDKIYMVNPATPGAPRYLVDGDFPVWIWTHALGRRDPAAVAAR